MLFFIYLICIKNNIRHIRMRKLYKLSRSNYVTVDHITNKKINKINK